MKFYNSFFFLECAIFQFHTLGYYRKKYLGGGPNKLAKSFESKTSRIYKTLDITKANPFELKGRAFEFSFLLQAC